MEEADKGWLPDGESWSSKREVSQGLGLDKVQGNCCTDNTAGGDEFPEQRRVSG